jgi:hypothetical protein
LKERRNRDTCAQAVLERLRLAAWWNGRHSRLKICFWETGVPVRVRPRPPKSVKNQIAMPAGQPADCARQATLFRVREMSVVCRKSARPYRARTPRCCGCARPSVRSGGSKCRRCSWRIARATSPSPGSRHSCSACPTARTNGSRSCGASGAAAAQIAVSCASVSRSGCGMPVAPRRVPRVTAGCDSGQCDFALLNDPRCHPGDSFSLETCWVRPFRSE